MQKMKLNKSNGITLIALILTVIIMIIMAGISFNALVGDNGILNQAANSKTKYDEESSKEALGIVWSAKMSRFYEDLSAGKATYDDIGRYFNQDELNEMLGENGEIKSISYDKTKGTFFIKFTTRGNVELVGEVSKSGDLTQLVKKENYYTQVWANYFKKDEDATIVYTTSSLGNSYNGQTNWDEVYNWDITKIKEYEDVPWRDLRFWSYVKSVIVQNDVVPENTNFMFYHLNYASNIEGVQELLYRLTEIGSNMFCGFEKLETIEIPSNINSIGERGFFQCMSLTNLKFDNGLTSIGQFAFDGCYKLTELELPESLITLGYEAFYGCTELKTVTIPESVKKIGWNCFLGCTNITKVNYNAIDATDSIGSDGTYCYPFFDNSDNINEIILGNKVEKIPDYAFFKCNNISNIVLPNSVTSIGLGSFYQCNLLTEINLENVTNIGECAFAKCPLLALANLQSATNIGFGAFCYCSALKTLSFSNSLVTIDSYSFYQCTALESITIPENVKKLGDYCFAYCSGLDTITYNATNASETDVYTPEDDTVAPPFSNSGKHLIIGDNVESLPDYIFRSMANCTEVTLPDELKTIGKEAFQNWKMTSIIIPSSVETIGEDCFKNCSSLTNITINKATDSISGSPWGAPNATINWTL